MTVRAEHAPANIIVELMRRIHGLESRLMYLLNAQNPTVPVFKSTDFLDEDSPPLLEQQIFFTTDDLALNVVYQGVRRIVVLTDAP